MCISIVRCYVGMKQTIQNVTLDHPNFVGKNERFYDSMSREMEILSKNDRLQRKELSIVKITMCEE